METARVVPANKALEIGLWVASGKIWVKGVVINGISTGTRRRRACAFSFRGRSFRRRNICASFSSLSKASARKSQSENAYVAKLKR